MRLFLIAFQFLTIIPVPPLRCEPRDLGRSMAFFPLVGLTLGGLLAGLHAVLNPLFPLPVTALLLIGVLTVVTGCLHLDGFADMCDGFAARGSRERFLEVMKDPRAGAAGAAGAAFTILMKYVALLQVPAEMTTPVLLLFPMIGRCCQVQMTMGATRARQDGLGAAFVEGAGWPQFGIAATATVVAAWFACGLGGLQFFVTTYVVTLCIKKYFHRRLGGITGDIIGATSEIAEMTVLILATALLKK